MRSGQVSRVEPKPKSKSLRPWGKKETGDAEVIPGTHEAIIDKDLFNAAQKVLAARRESNKGAPHLGGKAKTSPYLLSGLVECDLCPNRCTGHARNKGKKKKDGDVIKNYYYQCSGNGRKGSTVCRGGAVPKADLESGVIDLIAGQVRSFLARGGTELLERVIARELKIQNDDPRKEIRKLERDHKDLERKIHRLVDEVIESANPDNRVLLDERLTELRLEMEQVESRLGLAREAAHHEIDVARAAEEIVRRINRFEEVFEVGTLEEKKGFIQLFVEKIKLNAPMRKARVYLRKFPAPEALGLGNLLLVLVAGTGFEPATFGLCVPLQLSLPMMVCGLDFLFTLGDS